jgi:non-ribosomal peptide synthetase component F
LFRIGGFGTAADSIMEDSHVLVRNLSDIAAIEAVPLSERALPESSHAALVTAAQRTADAKALSFFLSADRLDETHVWTFAACGVASDRPVAFVLPNLPETHFTIWGSEAAGAAFAINPMLQPKQIADLMRFARAAVLVTLVEQGMVRFCRRAAVASRPQDDRVRRHGRLPRRREATGLQRLGRGGRGGLPR